MALDDVAHLAARLGRLLLSYGADTRDTQNRIAEFTRCLGHEAHVMVGTEALLLTVTRGAQLNTRVGHEIGNMGADMGKLLLLEGVLADVRTGALPPDRIDARLDEVEKARGTHANVTVVLGMAVTAASLARLFGADWPVVGGAFVAGLVSMLMRRSLARFAPNPIALVFATAFVSGLCGTLFVRLVPGASPVLCLTAAGMILVPGVNLINGVRDLVNGQASNGVARLVLGSTTVLTIGFALFIAASVAGDVLPVDATPGSLPLAEDLLFAALAAAGFALFFNVPSRLVWVCVVCGMCSHGLRLALVHGGFDLAAASLAGAFVAGIVARGAGSRLGVPPVAFAFAGIVALVPGSYAFRAGIGGLNLMKLGGDAPPTLIADTFSLTISAVIMTIAIATGLMLALAHSRVRGGAG